MGEVLTKYVGELRQVTVDFGADTSLTLPTADAVAAVLSVEVTLLTPGTHVTLALGTPSLTGSVVAFLATGGATGDEYLLEIIVRTTGNLVLVGTCILDVLEGGTLSPLPSVLRLGYATFDYGLSDVQGAGVVLAPGSKLLVAGISDDNVSNFNDALSRWLSDGVLDSSYNGTGKYTVPHPAGSTHEECTSLHLQVDGKVVIGGLTFPGSAYVPFSFTRLLVDALTLDSTYGSGGFATTPFNSSLALMEASVLQADGKMVGAGLAYSANFSTIAAAVARFTTAGAPDGTFGVNGEVQVSNPDTLGVDQFLDVKQQADGKLVAAGLTRTVDNLQYAFLVVRLTTGGALDSTFGTGGIVITHDADNPPNDLGACLVVLASNKILVGGGSDTDSGGVSAAVLVTRLDSVGTTDATFGTGGFTKIASVGSITPIRNATVLALQSTGKIIVLCPGKFNSDPLVILRLSADGALDPTFGSGGAFSFVIPGNRVYADHAGSLLVLSDDSIVITGQYGTASGNLHGLLLKVTSNGVLDTTFGDLP